MWYKRECGGSWCWERDNGDILMITHRTQYDVEVNHKPVGKGKTLQEAVDIAKEYVKDHF